MPAGRRTFVFGNLKPGLRNLLGNFPVRLGNLGSQTWSEFGFGTMERLDTRAGAIERVFLSFAKQTHNAP